jgi:hypothetical protein
MPRAFFSESILTDNRGPLLMGCGLAFVLAAQLWSMIPLAAAIALIGLGATFTLQRRHPNELLLALNFAVYVSLVALAIVAQMNLHNNLLTQCDAILAIVLIIGTMPRTFIGSC